MRDDTDAPRTANVAEIEADRDALDASIASFAKQNAAYYQRAFRRIQEATGPYVVTFNPAAALLGPIWCAARGLWGGYWGFLILEIIAWVQIGRGTWGELGAENIARAEQQEARAQGFLDRAAEAAADGEDPSRFETLGNNLLRAAERSREEAAALAADSLQILIVGLAILVAIRLAQGLRANTALEKKYEEWRISPERV